MHAQHFSYFGETLVFLDPASGERFFLLAMCFLALQGPPLELTAFFLPTSP
jgi:hypothetical protein